MNDRRHQNDTVFVVVYSGTKVRIHVDAEDTVLPRQYPDEVLAKVPAQAQTITRRSESAELYMDEFEDKVEEKLPIVNRTQLDVCVLDTRHNPTGSDDIATLGKRPSQPYRIFYGTATNGFQPILAAEQQMPVSLREPNGIIVKGPVILGAPTGIDDIEWDKPETHVGLILTLLAAKSLCDYMFANGKLYCGMIYTPGDIVRGHGGKPIGCLNLRLYHSPETPYVLMRAFGSS